MSSEHPNAPGGNLSANPPDHGHIRALANLFAELPRAGVRIDRKLDRLFAPVSGFTPELESLLARLRQKE